MLKKIRTLLASTMFYRVFLIYIFIFAVPIIILFMSLYSKSKDMILNQGGHYLISHLKSISQTMDEVFRSVDSINTQVQIDINFMDLNLNLKKNDEIKNFNDFLLQQKIAQSLRQFYISNDYINSIELYNPISQSIFACKTFSTRSMIHFPDHQQISDIKGSKDTLEKYWYIERDEQNIVFSKYTSLAMPGQEPNKLHLKTTINNQALKQKVSTLGVVDDQYSLFAFDNSTLILVDDSLEIPNSKKLINVTNFSGQSGYLPISANNTEYIMAYFKSQHTDWYFIALTPSNYINSPLVIIFEYFWYFIIAIICIFIISIIVVWFYILSPLKDVGKIMDRTEKGDLSRRILTQRKDEIGSIQRKFNLMLDNINSLIYENYQTKLIKKDIQLKYLQTQINEHFLYNTLDSIHWIARKHNVPQVSTIIFNLSKFFRLSLSQGKDLISIDEVASLLDSYMTLINLRIDNEIKFTIRVDEEIKNKLVLKYIFQPLIENAIIHGIDNDPGGEITVTFTEILPNLVRFQVTDNGLGISEEKLAEIIYSIRNKINDDSFFALRNINQQLKFFYETECNIQINSIINEGTVVTIDLPIKETGI